MKFSEILKKVESSSKFKNFKKKNPRAYLAAGFFVFDYESGNNMNQLDYVAGKKIYTFYISADENEEDIKIKEELKKEKKLPNISRNVKKIKIDLVDIKKIVENETEKLKAVNKINKIIAVLQSYEGKLIWNLTCMLGALQMLRIHINAESGKILKDEKASVFDFVKQVK